MIEPAGYIIHGVARGMEDVEKLAFAVPGHPPKRPHTPLYAIPAGYVLVKAEPKDEDLFRAWVKVANGTIDDIDRFQAAYKAMIEGEQ